MEHDVQSAILAGDVAGLSTILAATPALADAEIRWGENGRNSSCPLHYLCHAHDDGRVDAATAVALADALIAAGANIEHLQPSGDTPLIAAASLWSPEVGLRLLAAGADVHARGLFKATALHWAARLGLPTLVQALIDAGADLRLKDDQYRCNALEWSVHAQATRAYELRGDPLACVKLLRAAGADVAARWRADDRVTADAALVAALS